MTPSTYAISQWLDFPEILQRLRDPVSQPLRHLCRNRTKAVLDHVKRMMPDRRVFGPDAAVRSPYDRPCRVFTTLYKHSRRCFRP